MCKLTAQDVAKYFLSHVDEDCGDCITNLKLQKLLYYAQGFHLAMFNKPLFDDPIEAWEHGPVVPKIYRIYKDFGANSLPKPGNVDLKKYSKKVRELLDEIYRIFGQFSAWKLRNMTHEEDPWKNTDRDTVISHEAMKRYFKTQLIEN